MLRLVCLNLLIFSLISCGIEDYLFLYPVPQGNITTVGYSKATIRLPAIDLTEYYYFTNFTIYYRIYITAHEFSEARINEDDMKRLNPTLYADYAAFLPYTNNDTNISTAIGTLFSNRKYQVLALEGANIEQDILARSAPGKTTTLDFIQTPGSIPVFSIDDTQYNLWRSTGNDLFRPVPENRYFFNALELLAPENISSTVNADVVGVDGQGDFTYVSMYIVVTGIDANLSPIYSAPAFIGIFRLSKPQ